MVCKIGGNRRRSVETLNQLLLIRRVFSVSLVAFFLVSCIDKRTDKASQYSSLFKVSDDVIQTYSVEGNELSVIERKEYKRVIVLATPLSIFFTLLQGENNVVGILNKSRVSSGMKRIESVGEEGKIDIEKIISLQPDLIICNTYQGEEIKGVKVKKLLVDEYLEVSPKKRITFSYMIGSLIGKESEGRTLAIKAALSKYKYKKLGVSVCKIDNFGGTWFEPGCDAYISRLILGAGADFKCVENSEKSEKISDEKVTVELANSDYLLFLDWAKGKKGYKDRLNFVWEFNNYPKKIIYCNTLKSKYFEQSMVGSSDLISDLHNVIQFNRKGKFFEILEFEE